MFLKAAFGVSVTNNAHVQPTKTPKTATKLKLTTPKAPAEEGGKKTPASKTKKASTKKGKAATNDEEAAAEAKEQEKQVDPEQLKQKKEKEGMYSAPACKRPLCDQSCLHYAVLFLRHKLQKGFISRDQPPKEDEMATMATYFDKLEKHADLEVSIIRSTKINKVLKMIVKLSTIPRDEEFNFRQRAMNILSSWKNVLDSDVPGVSGDKEAKATPNGVAKDDETAETPKLETAEEKETDSKAAKDDTPMADADADADKAAPQPANDEQKETIEGEKPMEASA